MCRDKASIGYSTNDYTEPMNIGELLSKLIALLWNYLNIYEGSDLLFKSEKDAAFYKLSGEYFEENSFEPLSHYFNSIADIENSINNINVDERESPGLYSPPHLDTFEHLHALIDFIVKNDDYKTKH